MNQQRWRTKFSTHRTSMMRVVPVLASPGLPAAPWWAGIGFVLARPGCSPVCPIKAPLAGTLCNSKICIQKIGIELPNLFTRAVKQPSDDNRNESMYVPKERWKTASPYQLPEPRSCGRSGAGTDHAASGSAGGAASRLESLCLA